MNCHEAYAEEIRRGVWADPNPNRCGCRGGGWWVSDFDSWHRCPFHGDGVPTPECDYPEEARDDYDRGAHERRICVDAYRHFRDEGVRLGVTPDVFEAICRCDLGAGEHTPREWVDAANVAVEELARTLADSNAQAAGYSCDLERRWTEGDPEYLEAVNRLEANDRF